MYHKGCIFKAVLILLPIALFYSMAKGKVNQGDGEQEQEILDKLGARIRELRQAKEANYEKFAFKHDLNRMQVWRYENGKDLKFTSLLKIVKALDVSLAEFFGKGFE